MFSLLQLNMFIEFIDAYLQYYGIKFYFVFAVILLSVQNLNGIIKQ